MGTRKLVLKLDLKRVGQICQGILPSSRVCVGLLDAAEKSLLPDTIPDYLTSFGIPYCLLSNFSAPAPSYVQAMYR